MKKIVIDCRYLGKSGVGRVLENVLLNLDYSKDNYYIFWGQKKYVDQFQANEYIYDDVSPLSMKSMINKNVKKINCADILFTPYFIIPYGIKVKIISMIHDMILLDMPELNKNKIEYLLKKYIIKRGIKKSKYIVTVSQFSLDRISAYYPKYKQKYSFHYLGVTDDFKSFSSSEKKKNQVVFVGNIKKHKGLKTLIEAYSNIESEIDLVIVGDDKNFRNGDKEISNLISKTNITFTGRVSDKDLKRIISESKFLIQPSLYEGFGLPPLEALYLGTKPIVSDIEVFREIYNDLPVLFFEKNNAADLQEKILHGDASLNLDIDKLNQKFSYKKFTSYIEIFFDETKGNEG